MADDFLGGVRVLDVPGTVSGWMGRAWPGASSKTVFESESVWSAQIMWLSWTRSWATNV